MKKAFVLALTVLLVFALASCGTDKDQLAYALGHRDSIWNSVEYSPYTAGIVEPKFQYEIMGVNQVGGFCIEIAPKEDELQNWKQSLLETGFVVSNTDGDLWAADSITHYVQIQGDQIYIIGKQMLEASE